jgi:hypothetical protein
MALQTETYTAVRGGWRAEESAPHRPPIQHPPQWQQTILPGWETEVQARINSTLFPPKLVLGQ